MIKVAQKKFKDPKRQHLEDKKQNIFKAKKIWNGYLKNFREELKVTQALINGRVEGGDKIRITDQLPEETAQNLSNLAESFQKRIEEGNQIFQAQNKYSEEYNNFFAELEQKRMQRLEGSKMQQHVPSGKKAASLDYNLISEAGIGPIGLFWESLKSFFSDSEGNRRVSLLKQLASLDGSLSRMEKEIISARKAEEIDSIRKRMYDLYRKVKSLKSIVSYGKKLKEKRLSGELGIEESSGAGNSENIEIDDKVKSILNDLEDYDFFNYRMQDLSNEKKSEINKIYQKIIRNKYSLESRPNSEYIKELIIENYRNLIQKCFDGSFDSFKSFKDLRRQASSTYNQIIKIAQSNPYDPLFFKFKKWLSSIGLSLNIFLNIRSNLMDASEVVSDCRKNLINNCINDLKSNDEINYELHESSLKECSVLLEQSINNLDSVSTFITNNSINDETFRKVNESVEKSTLKKLLSLFGKGVKRT